MFWGTGYDGGLYDDSDAPSDYSDSFNYEKYYLKLAAEGKASVTVEFFDWYRFTPTLYIKPFTMRVLEAWVLWFRPES